jgi:hypothetical protein
MAARNGAQVGLPQGGGDRSAGQLAVGQLDPVAAGSHGHLLEELGADLMAEAARTAVNADHDITFVQAERVRHGAVEDFGDVLHFQVMVARAKRAHLVALTGLGVLRDLLGLGPCHAAMLLDPLQIFGPAVAALHRPLGAAGQHGIHLTVVQVQPAGAAHTRRYPTKQNVGQLFLDGLDVFPLEAGVQAADAAGNIETDAAGRDNAPLLGVERGHATNRKAVAPVGIRHGVGGLDNAGESGHVTDLLIDLEIHVLNQRTSGVDDAGHAHLAGGLDPPLELGFAGQQARVHGNTPHG